MIHGDMLAAIGRGLAMTLLGTAASFPAAAAASEYPAVGKALAASPLLTHEEDLDLRAVRLMSDPAIVAASKEGADRLRASLPDATPESLARFAQAVEQITFFGIVNGLNDDPSHPGITFINRPGRMVRGVFTPATKGLDENPDTVYRIIPVDGVSTYVLHGRAALGHRPLISEFSVLNDPWQTVGNLSGDDLKLDTDGSFAITIGPEPAAGRPNYIQTKPDANYMTIRDTLGDWAGQRPNRLSVERVAGPAVAPLSDAALIQKAVVKIKRYFAETLRIHQLALKQPANFFPQPLIRAEYGMLVTQAYSIGRFELQDGQALVLTIRPGPAKYLVVPVTSLWGTTGDAVHHVSSLNSQQAAANQDGSISFIISPTDPGVRNWVDTEGLKEGFLFIRWAAIGGGPSVADQLGVKSEVVPLDKLSGVAPAAALVKIDKAARARQLADRARDYDLRWAGD